MKKRIFMFGVVIVLLSLVLAACGAESKFIGTWEDQYGYQIIFKKDGVYEEPQAMLLGSGNYELLDGNKIVFKIGGLITLTYSYEFDGNNTLMLTDNLLGQKTVYTRK